MLVVERLDDMQYTRLTGDFLNDICYGYLLKYAMVDVIGYETGVALCSVKLLADFCWIVYCFVYSAIIGGI